jgi:triphosphoribosyl-dephospho-CoA synthase
VLLLAPLAAVDPAVSLRDEVGNVLRTLTVRDAELVYEAIRLSQPGGMGMVEQGDITTGPTGTLLEMMQLAADRDAVARQYATDFDLVLNFAVPKLAAGWPAVWNDAKASRERQRPKGAEDGDRSIFRRESIGAPQAEGRKMDQSPSRWEEAVIRLHLELMARCPDTLIARKCGAEIATESARRALAVLQSVPDAASVRDAEEFIQFDRWLRADGHRRNPGTTADLVTAALFAALREGAIDAPAFV